MSEAEPRVVHLDICPYGDMEIFLATSAIDVTYRVSSHQLCSGSTFFRAMLGPQSSFSEANGLRRHQSSSSTAPDSNANGSLFRITAEEEHDPTALATVLYVLHGRAQYIPESITFKNLLEVAIICDYYDCAAAMRPWDGIWMGPLKSLASSPGYESWLFISWVFGDQEVFGQMTKKFSRDGVMVDGEFGVMVGGKVERLDCHLPQGIIDAMADQRHKIGQEFVVACSDVLAKYDNDDTIKCTMSRRECDYIIYGGLRRGLKSNKLLSSDEGLHLDHIFQTVESMMGDVTRSIQSVGTLGNRNSYHYHQNFNRHHSCCNTIDEVLKILRAKLEGIKPLHLTSFSRESAASDSCTWDALLCPQRVSRNSSLRLVRLEICKFGDMEITLKTADIHATYLVSSHQLRTSSPVFRDLLSPDSEFGEHTRSHQGQTSSSGFSTDSGDRFQLEVQKDIDPTAFAVVLYILHAGGANLPGSIPFAGIVAVGVVCQYYECSASLGRWYGKWIDQWKNYTENNGYGDWLLLALVFGENQIFQTLTKKFSERGILENNEFLITSEEPRFVERLSEHTPQIIIDSMIEQRNKACEKIFKACKDIYEKYSDDTTSKCRAVPQYPAGKICDHCIYGELHMGLKAAKLLKNDFDIGSDSSPSCVVAELQKMNGVMQSLSNLNFGGYSHYNCTADISGLVQTAQAAINDIKPLPLSKFGRNSREAWESAVSWDSVLAGTGSTR